MAAQLGMAGHNMFGAGSLGAALAIKELNNWKLKELSGFMA
jgi:metal-dependent amidase/aminoacylase/carboxypeptidase family protein